MRAPADGAPDAGARLKLAAIGTPAGLFSGLFGVGGGTVIVPLLMLWLGYEERAATAPRWPRSSSSPPSRRPSRACTATCASCDALLVGIPGVGGVLIGAWLAQRVPASADLAAVRGRARGERGGARAAVIGAIADRPGRRRSSPACSGVGGGVLFVPGLVIFLGLGQHQAEATSLLAIVPVAIVGDARTTATATSAGTTRCCGAPLGGGRRGRRRARERAFGARSA